MGIQLTYQDLLEENAVYNNYVVIHDNIYDCSQFIDEHPGGEEVLIEVYGRDATEAFEDVGHSDAARERLSQLQIGVLKRQPGELTPKKQATVNQSIIHDSSSLDGIGRYAVPLICCVLVYVGYQYSLEQDKHHVVHPL